jgi:hypothetical protein
MRNHDATIGTKADEFRGIEVITGVGRRRRWTDEEKALKQSSRRLRLAILHRLRCIRKDLPRWVTTATRAPGQSSPADPGRAAETVRTAARRPYP